MSSIRLFLCIVLFGAADAANILGLLPFYGTSHNLVTMPLFEELARRGHNVTLAGFHQPKTPNPNLEMIHLKIPGDRPLRGFLSTEDYLNSNYMSTMYLLRHQILAQYDKMIGTNKFESIFERKYDLVITELFDSDLFMAYIHKLGVPFIAFHTCEPFPWHRDTLADPVSPALIPHAFSKKAAGMDFFGRFWNTVEVIRMMAFYQLEMVPEAQRIAEKHLGPLPPLNEVTKNASLYFTNTHNSLYGPRPMNPSTIEVGGLHVFPPKPLPKELQALLDSSKNGVIYFSMGSVLRGSSMNPEKQATVLKAFSKLKETVLWKFEDDVPQRPSNLHVSPWFPQRDIFAHPNIVLFISHCGLLSVHEAITEAIPMLCLPMFGDQHMNAKALKRNGMALDLNYADLTEDVLFSAIEKILRDPSFKENAKRVSKAFLDRPLSAMDTAVYWSEYVIRHEGAPHLRSPARDMKWWEYYNLDVIGTLLIIALSAVFLTYKMLKSLFCSLVRKSTTKSKVN